MKEHITIIGAGNLTMSILEAIKDLEPNSQSMFRY